MTLEKGSGGPELGENVVVAGHRRLAIKPRAQALQLPADVALEALKSRAYRAANFLRRSPAPHGLQRRNLG
jgi:hypothetical protein